jgi:thiol-disulfide isomerase/thioredoxin
MRNIILIIPALLLSMAACTTIKATGSHDGTQEASQTRDTSKDLSDPKTFVLGYFDRNKLSNGLHSEWFTKEYEDYSFNTSAVNALLDKSNANISVKIVMGTWCPDSRREVPRFMKILDMWQLPSDKVTFIGVDKKKSPSVPEFQTLGIERVPTIIIYENKIEKGRIIETPQTSLEQDLVNILNKE